MDTSALVPHALDKFPDGATEPAHRATLTRILQDLGDTVLAWRAGPADEQEVNERVVIYDASDDDLSAEGSLVLAIGVRDEQALVALVAECRMAGAAAIIVRDVPELPTHLLDDITLDGPTLLELRGGATWHQLVTLLGSILRPRDATSLAPPEIGGVPTGDLFSLANAICALIDAPVTIEDRSSTVLAFSDRQDEGDFIRIECILGRKTPEDVASIGEATGAHQAIRRATRPLFIEPMKLPDRRKTRGRVVVPIRAGDELLGTIWGVVDAPLTPERDDQLLEASRLVALHMLHHRTGGDVSKRIVNDLVLTALEGGPAALDALTQLGLTDSPCVVVALTTSAEPSPDISIATMSQRAARQQRIADAFALHLALDRPLAKVAVQGMAIYAIVPAQRQQDAELNIRKSCQSFVMRLSTELPLIAAIGHITPAGEGVLGSRRDADRAARAMRSAGSSPAAACAADIEVEALLLDLRDLVTSAERQPTGAYSRLLAYDAEKDGFMLETLRAWLDAHGDIALAAAAAHVHQNTFRYRLRRLSEVGGVDLNDPRERLGLLLQMEVYPASQYAPKLNQ